MSSTDPAVPESSGAGGGGGGGGSDGGGAAGAGSDHPPLTIHSVNVGDFLDVKDSIDHWMEAEVVEKTADAIHVHYVWWTCQWDEWLRLPSLRVAPHGSRCFLEGGTLRKGQIIEVFDSHPKQKRWCEGEVVDESPDQVKVHFKGWVSKFDTWFPRSSPMLSPFGKQLRLRMPHITRNRRVVFESQLDTFHAALARQDMRVVPCAGDGNCLFRAVSHQLYGTEDCHRLIRESAVDYMSIEKAHYASFTMGDAEYFQMYLTWKRTDGVWGDDLELQAMSELYRRPIHVYAYHPVDGAVLLNRAASEAGDPRPPIRLSFYGGGHYDSIVGPGWTENHLKEPPGSLEKRRMDTARSAADPSVLAQVMERSDAESVEAATVAAALAESRRLYASQAHPLEAALTMAMGSAGTEPATAAAAAAAMATGGDGGGGSGSGSGAASTAGTDGTGSGMGSGDVGATEAMLLAKAQAESEEMMLAKARAESERLATEQALRKAAADSEAAALVEEVEAAELRRLLNETRAQVEADEDLAMAQALAMSMED